MKKRKIIALTLLAAFLCSLCIPGTWAIAEDGDNPPVPENKGMEISKIATPNGDGTYTITLEAYATGEKISSTVQKDVPTDIILVLDQSKSMAGDMSSEKVYHPYAGQNNFSLYDYRFNNGNSKNHNLFYPVGNGHAQVSVDRSEFTTYIEQDIQTINFSYWQNRNNLWIKGSDGGYQKVTVSEKSGTYTYRVNGRTIAQSTGFWKVPDFDGYGPGYVSGTDYKYTYYYQLAGQERVVIETSIGRNTVPEEIYYNRGTVTTSRLEALRDAVANFSNSVAEKAKGTDKVLGTSDDVNHRIAVVGFASQSGYGYNTELLSISGGNSGSVGVAYNNITDQGLKDVLQNMDVKTGQDMVNSAIDALDAKGATQADLGMDMAMRILIANPVPDGEKRNRVVIFFTDGSPTSYRDFEENVADAAIGKAKDIKDGGATVYSVGVFPGADATENGIATDHPQKKENQFMQDVSSNKGTPQIPSYYLSASDSSTLNNIFEQISGNIESGGSSTTLGSEAVIRDVISPAFSMPSNAKDIKVYTADSNGSTNEWRKRVLFNGTVGVDPETNTVSVSGFSFKDNWCGSDTTNGQITFHDGKKLIIEFNVVPKDDFLGGNGVYTNTSAGVYENAEAENPLFTFDRPQVDVPIKEITVTAEDKNVYLLGDLTAEQIKSGATAKVGEVTLDLTKADQNYGLATWQHEYVDIAVAYADKEGEVVIDLNDLTDDTTYTVTVKVVPKYEGEIKEKTGRAEGKINVFKPVLTFKDGEVYYGADVPDNDTLNKESFVPGATVWKHNETNADSVTMIGTAPANNKFAMTYAVDSGKIENGKINSKTVDIPVDVATVKIGDVDVTDHTTFQHIDCQGKTCTMPAGKEFLLHPQTCQLTVCKTGGAAGEPYVFNVYEDGDTNKPYTQVTIVGNDKETIYELPVGTYTIQEDTGWSWRYRGNNGDAAVLSATNPTGEITCTNSKNDNKWLNGYSTVVKNIFGVSHNN